MNHLCEVLEFEFRASQANQRLEPEPVILQPNVPYLTHQDKAFALAMKCMLAIRTSEMDALLQSLDPELIDTLMKYIYRGFESPSEGSSGHLLAWHEKAFAHGGLGSIIRVMTARKTV